MEKKEKEALLRRWAKREKTFRRDVEAEIAPFISSRHAVFFFGPRQSGKSTVAKRLMWQQGKGAKKVYVNLEDPALEGALSVPLLDEFAEGLEEGDLLVLDEVQLVPSWEKWVRRAVETRQCKLIVTGSSAKLLSSEFATSLGGRGIGFRVLPLSFCEFARVRRTGSLTDYLEIGGYPEVVLDPQKREKLLEGYFELTIVKDIAVRYGIKNVASLRTLAFYLLTNSGKLTSLKQIRAALGIAYDTSREYMDRLEAAFLVFQVPFFSYSMKESLARQRKVYAVDSGMQAYASKSFSPDFGRKAETAVAVELLRRGFELYYWKGKREVDFVARKKLGLVPVNVSFAKELKEREVEGLAEFCSSHKAKEAVILYLGASKTVGKEGFTLHLVNLEDWLLKKAKFLL